MKTYKGSYEIKPDGSEHVAQVYAGRSKADGGAAFAKSTVIDFLKFMGVKSTQWPSLNADFVAFA